MENSQKRSGSSGNSSTFTELQKPSAFKPFLLLIVVFVLMQATGTYAVIFYAVSVFKVSFKFSTRLDFVKLNFESDIKGFSFGEIVQKVKLFIG